MSTPASAVFRRAPGVRWREFGSDGILLDPQSGEYVQINDMGLLIWNSFDEPATLDVVVDRVGALCEEMTDQATADIQEFVTALAQGGFLLFEPS